MVDFNRPTGPIASGRTWRLVNDARDGDIYIVASYEDAFEVERILHRQGRRRDALILLPLDASTGERLHGQARGKRVYVDHRAHERCCQVAMPRRAPAAGARIVPLTILQILWRRISEVAEVRFGGIHLQPCNTVPPGSPPVQADGTRGADGA